MQESVGLAFGLLELLRSLRFASHDFSVERRLEKTEIPTTMFDICPREQKCCAVRRICFALSCEPSRATLSFSFRINSIVIEQIRHD